MPGFELLAQRIEELRRKDIELIAAGILTTSNEVDQRRIDYKRGFWQGAMFVARRLPKTLAKGWDAVVAEANKEGEDTV